VPDLSVDLDAVSDVARRLRRIERALSRTEQLVDRHLEDLGDPQVQHSASRFERRWRDGRKALESDAATLGTMAEESVRTYRDVDHRLGAAVRAAVQR
jgi:hypothetical protein